MGLQSKVSALLQKSPGNVRTDAERIRSADNPNGKDIANAVVGLQIQLDAIKNALTQNPTLQELTVQDTDGSLIAWIGDRVVNGISYIGAYFRKIWIGGTGPADANIIADSSGVSINGAGITLTKNGVTTTLNNTIAGSDSDVESLKSLDIASGYYSYVNPFEFQVDGDVSGTPVTLASIGGAGGQGSIRLFNSTHTASLQASVGVGSSITFHDTLGGSSSISSTGFSSTGGGLSVALDISNGLSVAGTHVIDLSKNGTLASLALSTPLATTSGGTGNNFANFSALVAAIEASFGGVSGSVSFITGLSASTTVIDYLDHSSNPQSATVLTGVSGSSSTIIFTNGIRTT